MINLENICKNYNQKKVLENINLKIDKGDFIMITGVTGSGKTTLLNIIGQIEKADSGTLFYDNVIQPGTITKMNKNILKIKYHIYFKI